MSKMADNITDAASYESYLNKLFIKAVTSRGTQRSSINDILLDQALECGRTLEEAQSDMKHILNIKSAINIIISNVAKAQYPAE